EPFQRSVSAAWHPAQTWPPTYFAGSSSCASGVAHTAPNAIRTRDTVRHKLRSPPSYSKGKIRFQSFFMLITVQPRAFASSISETENVPTLVSGRSPPVHTRIPARHHRDGRAFSAA